MIGTLNVPPPIIAAYLLWMFAWMFVASSSVMLWPELLHRRQLAVGGAAINTMCQIGGFAMPYAWGAARDATGSFRFGLGGLAMMIVVAWMIAYALARRSRGIEPAAMTPPETSSPTN